METTAGPRAVAAYVALREDLIWTLENDQLRIMTTLTPDGPRRRPRRLGPGPLGGPPLPRRLHALARVRGQRGLGLRAKLGPLGQSAGSRADRGHPRAARSRSPAACPRRASRPIWPGSCSRSARASRVPYVAYVRSRVDAMAGDYPRALARLDSVLAGPAQVSRDWIRIDRTLEPLRGRPGWSALGADAYRHPLTARRPLTLVGSAIPPSTSCRPAIVR